jgi:hypothetical protein
VVGLASVLRANDFGRGFWQSFRGDCPRRDKSDGMVLGVKGRGSKKDRESS